MALMKDESHSAYRRIFPDWANRNFLKKRILPVVKSTRDTTRSVVESEGTFIAQEKGKRPIGFSLGREGSPLYIYIFIYCPMVCLGDRVRPRDPL